MVKFCFCCGVNDSWKVKFIFALEAAKKVLLLQRAGLQTAKIYSSSSLGREVLQSTEQSLCISRARGRLQKSVRSSQEMHFGLDLLARFGYNLH